MSKFGIRLAIPREFVVAICAVALSTAGMIRLRADEIPNKLAAYMDAAVKVDKFSGSVLLAKHGEVLFENGYGMANSEHQVPNTPETKFRLGSVTKQFTATAILILQDQGKLKVGDRISKHLVVSPKEWEKVTIHHLLTHTSGIPSYTDDFAYRLQMTKPETVTSMIARFKDKPLDFESGSKFHYNNSGYFLLGAIIEKVSGKSYEGFLKEVIFEPLGMSDTGYDRPEKVLEKRASGYERRGQELVNAPYLDMIQPFSAGALYSTVKDMLRWDRALHEGKLLSKDAMAAMFTPFKNEYAYGWGIGEQHGHKRVGHGGGINGFASDFQRYPDDELCVVVLSNVVPSNPSKVSRDLASIVFGEPVSIPKAREMAKVDPKIYDAYVGKYELGPAFVLTVTREGDRLMTQATGQGKIEVFPESETEFFAKAMDAQLTFVKEKNQVTHLMVHQNGRARKAPRLETVPAVSLKIHRDLAYAEPKNDRQILDVYAAAEGKDRPIVFWIHGGGWQRGDKSDVQTKPQAFVDNGFVFVSTNYRFVPDVTIKEMAGDVATAIRWIHDHAQEHGGDPNRIFVMGHSAGAQLAALVCTDERYLESKGLSLSIIKGCVPVDGDTYDVPLQIATVEERRAEIYKRKFGDAEQQKDLSPVTHVTQGKHIPPFLILHVAEHPETKAQSQRFAEMLQNVGISAKAFPAEGKTHTTINADLGTPDDKPSHALFEFVREQLHASGKPMQ